MKTISELQDRVFEVFMPFYFPKSRRFSNKLHLAIWNCGKRPQTLWRAIKDTRITIRKNNKPLFVIKKGDTLTCI